MMLPMIAGIPMVGEPRNSVLRLRMMGEEVAESSRDVLQRLRQASHNIASEIVCKRDEEEWCKQSPSRTLKKSESVLIRASGRRPQEHNHSCHDQKHGIQQEVQGGALVDTRLPPDLWKDSPLIVEHIHAKDQNPTSCQKRGACKESPRTDAAPRIHIENKHVVDVIGVARLSYESHTPKNKQA